MHGLVYHYTTYTLTPHGPFPLHSPNSELMLTCFSDINECKSGSHSCHSADYCIDTIGDYVCTCPEGLELSANGKSCLGKAVGTCECLDTSRYS